MIVSIVHVVKGVEVGTPMLNGRQVNRIAAYLVAGIFDENPHGLSTNSNTAFNGTKIYGQGFLFSDNDAGATPICIMQEILNENEINQKFIKPYIGGEDINISPSHRPSRYVINLTNLPIEEASKYPRHCIYPPLLPTARIAESMASWIGVICSGCRRTN